MANDVPAVHPVTDNSGSSALIGALLGGSLGALGGGLYADVDETATPSEKLKARLQTAALVGALGAAGGAGSGFLLGKAVAPSQSEIDEQKKDLANGDTGGETWGDIGAKLGIIGGGSAALGAFIRGTSGKYPGTTGWQRVRQGALRGGGIGIGAAGLVSLLQDHGLFK